MAQTHTVWASLALVWIVCACGSDQTRLVLSLPPGAEGNQALILALDSTAGIELFAFDLTDRSTGLEWPNPIDSLQSARIWSFVYPDSLSELLIPPGAVEILDEGRPIPLAASEYVSELDVDQPSWEARARSPQIAAVRIADPMPYCARFERRRIDGHLIMTGLSTALFVAPKIVALASGAGYYLVEGEVARPADDWAGGAPSQVATPIDASHAWVAGNSLVWTATVTPDALIGMRFGDRIIGPTGLDRGVLQVEGVPRALFVLQDSHELRLWDGEAWKVIYQFAEGGDNATSGLVSPRPGDAWAVHPSERRVVVLEAGELRFENVAGSAGGLTALADIDGLGLVVGNAAGQIFVRGTDVWESLGETQLARRVRAFYPMADGFLAAGDDGFGVQYVASEHRFCPSVRLADEAIRFIVRYDEGELLVGGSRHEPTQETPVTIVRPSLGL